MKDVVLTRMIAVQAQVVITLPNHLNYYFIQINTVQKVKNVIMVCGFLSLEVHIVQEIISTVILGEVLIILKDGVASLEVVVQGDVEAVTKPKRRPPNALFAAAIATLAPTVVLAIRLLPTPTAHPKLGHALKKNSLDLIFQTYLAYKGLSWKIRSSNRSGLHQMYSA